MVQCATFQTLWVLKFQVFVFRFKSLFNLTICCSASFLLYFDILISFLLRYFNFSWQLIITNFNVKLNTILFVIKVHFYAALKGYRILHTVLIKLTIVGRSSVSSLRHSVSSADEKKYHFLKKKKRWKLKDYHFM